MRRRLGLLTLFLLLPILLSGCSQPPELPTQALAPGMTEVMVSNELYFKLDVGPLPEGVNVEVEGYELTRGQGADADRYLVKVHDLLQSQNAGSESPFSVRMKLVYSLGAKTLREVPLSFETHAVTYLDVNELPEITTNDHLQVSGRVAPGSKVAINGNEVAPDETSRFSLVVPLTEIGENEVVITVSRPGEAANTTRFAVTRLGKLSTPEIRSAISLVEYASTFDQVNTERPVPAAVAQDVLRKVLAAPITDHPTDDTGGSGVGILRIFVRDKVAEMHVGLNYVYLNGDCYRPSVADQEMVNSLFRTPYEWPFRSWEFSSLPFELPQGTGTRTLPLLSEGTPLETLLVVYEEKDDANPKITRIVEVTPGKFEVHVARGDNLCRYDAVVLYNNDDHWEFKVIYPKGW